jgi:zinc transporter ZupT
VWVGVVAGLIAHIAGYLLRTSGPAEPLGLAADLLYSFGLAVWTGTVVVVLIEIIPQAKERQILEAIDAYEAAVSGGDSKRGT